jgi:hypothetical protein
VGLEFHLFLVIARPSVPVLVHTVELTGGMAASLRW